MCRMKPQIQGPQISRRRSVSYFFVLKDSRHPLKVVMANNNAVPKHDFNYFWEQASQGKKPEAPSNWKTPLILGGIFLIVVLGLLIFSFKSGSKSNILSALSDASLRVPIRS